MAEFDARIKLKRDTSSNWTTNNPVLLNGERIIVDTDAGEVRYKTGDGVKTYIQLPFDDEAVRNLVDSKHRELQEQINNLATNNDVSDEEFIDTLVGLGLIDPPAVDLNGAFYTDANGVILTL